MAAPQDENKRSPLKAWVRALELTAPIGRDPLLTLPVLIQRLAERFAEAPALLAPDCALSYRELGARCNRYARFALGQGLKPGDVVCLVMENCPQYLAVWLGLCRIGVTVALINTHVRGTQLAHSINLVAERDPRAACRGPALLGGGCQHRGPAAPR
jgi:fatty-acyl-CoA synthase